MVTVVLKSISSVALVTSSYRTVTQRVINFPVVLMVYVIAPLKYAKCVITSSPPTLDHFSKILLDLATQFH